MTQLDIDFDAPARDARSVDVWVWCAYLMSVEADNAMGQYAWPPVEPDHETADVCHAARERFNAKAGELLGRELTDDEWSASIERFCTPD